MYDQAGQPVEAMTPEPASDGPTPHRSARPRAGVVSAVAVALVIAAWWLVPYRQVDTYDATLRTEDWQGPCGRYILEVDDDGARVSQVVIWGQDPDAPEDPYVGEVVVEEWAAPGRDTRWRTEIPGLGEVEVRPDRLTHLSCDPLA